MKCFKCGENLPDDSKFCLFCGANLEQGHYCSKCGEILQENVKFCYKCGHPVCATQKEETVQVLAVEDRTALDPGLDEENPTEVVPSVVSVTAEPKTDIEKETPKNFWLVFVAAAVIFAAILAVVSQKRDVSQTMTPAQAAENVLYLEFYDSSEVCIGAGSGFLINDDVTLVTNYHVIEDAYHMIATTADGEQTVEVDTVLSYDESADLAILKCSEAIGVAPLVLADSDLVKQGDTVYAAGYPLGIANTLSDGIISSRYTDENGVDLLQITAPISGGSSGGALLNESGQVVGVVCAYYTDGQNMNIAIPSNTVAKLMPKRTEELSLQSFYQKTHPFAGLDSYYACVRTISVEIKEEASKIYAKWLAAGATEENIIELMDKYGAEQGGGKLHFVLPGEWVDEVNQWCFDKTRQIGDVTVIKTPYGYTLCYFSDAINVGKATNGSTLGYINKQALIEQYEKGEISQAFFERAMKILLAADTLDEYRARLVSN